MLRNPEDLTENQQVKLAWIALTDPDLHRAYLLKEGLRLIFKLPIEQAGTALDNWISWARAAGIGLFSSLAKRITRHRAAILAAIEHNEKPGRRLVDDDLAEALLPARLRLLVKTTKVDALRRAAQLASDRTGPGLWASIACRKRFIDERLSDPLNETDTVVVLGKGHETGQDVGGVIHPFDDRETVRELLEADR